MTTAEWVFIAVTEVLTLAPALTFGEASEVARQLHQGWPGVNAQDAVACYFAPSDPVSNGCAVGLR